MNKNKAFGNIAKVAISNILKLLSGVLVGFLLPKIIGVTEYGFYKTFTLYASYVGILAIGITDGIYLKYGGKDYEELDHNIFRFVSRFYLLFEIIISLIISAICFFSLDGDIQFIFLCLSVFIIASNITGYYQIISQITSRFNELSFRNLLQSVLTGVAILVLWLLHKYFNYSVSYRLFTVIYVGIMSFLAIWYLYTYREITFGKIDIIKNKRILIFDLIKVGVPLLVSNLCSSFILTIDRQFVNIAFDMDDYAIYAFAYSMLSLITTATSAISTVIYPMMKKMNTSSLINSYRIILSSVLVFVFGCLAVYFPLHLFISWFLPKYFDSLKIFRIILPGLAVQCAITIVMHNYYKTLGKNTLYFIISAIVLFLSVLANFIAYLIFRNTLSISFASIIILLIWYLISETYLTIKYKVKWIKNLLFTILMIFSFYLISLIEIWWIGFFIYLVFYLVIIFFFYYKDILFFYKKFVKKEIKE